MRKEDCYLLGNISRRHGLKGNVILRLDTDQPEYYQNLESVLIEINGLLVPFFIQSAVWSRGNSLNVLFQNTPETVLDQIMGKTVWMPLSTLPPLSGKQFYYHEVTGFEILDQHDESCGFIYGVNDQTAQHYFVTRMDAKEMVIPIIKDWILEIDRTDRKIQMKLPDGLREVFLGS